MQKCIAHFLFFAQYAKWESVLIQAECNFLPTDAQVEYENY